MVRQTHATVIYPLHLHSNNMLPASLTFTLPEFSSSWQYPTGNVIGHYSFAVRTVGDWNSLPSHVVEQSTTASFKAELSRMTSAAYVP